MADIQISVIDREGVTHELMAPTDMNMNLMEVCKAHELPVEGTCGGMALVHLASAMYSRIILWENAQMMRKPCSLKPLMYVKVAAWAVKYLSQKI